MNTSFKAVGLIAILFFPFFSSAQHFTRVTSGLDQLYKGGCSFGDLDNDGDYDLIMTGLNASDQSVAGIYINNNGSFLKLSSDLPQFGKAAIDLADFDNDLDLDLIVHRKSKIEIYRNDDMDFNLMPGEAPGTMSEDVRSICWVDLDNDGVLEIVAGGGRNNEQGVYGYYTDLFHYSNGTFDKLAHNIPRSPAEGIRYTDFNRDGLLDLLIVSTEFSPQPIILIN